MNRLLIQVVPRLEPGRCGVSDHAILLARELQTVCGIETAFVVLNSRGFCDAPFPAFFCTPAQLLERCLSLCEERPGAILVHLSGYGYSRDGAPAQLAEALARISAVERFPIATYFHELFASGPPWKSAFWYSRRQRNAVCKIAEDCDLLVTNTRYHADWLELAPVRRKGASVRLLPVFSTTGEVEKPVAISSRQPAMVVFGLPGTRQRAYKELAELGKMVHDLGVNEILDIGLEFDAPSSVDGIPVKRMGVLSATELAASLSGSLFGFVSHSPPGLAKSSVFAAYCAHGLIPVLATAFYESVDGLEDGVHVVSPESVTRVKLSGFEDCSLAAWNWYSSHRLREHAETYSQWLEQMSS